MTPDLAGALRAAARAALPEGAFLRRDRGEGLFVTDAPRHKAGGDWRAALSEAGFILAEAGGLTRLSPAPAWLVRLEARYPQPPDTFCAALARFAGEPPEPESLALFALGARTLDGEDDHGRFERQLRQRAAACLRLNRTQSTRLGGGLYACALLAHLKKEAFP